MSNETSRILYHGSNEIADTPMILITKYTKDFGLGFYTTNIFEQAEKWAYRKAQKGGVPTVSRYLYTPNESLDVLQFETTTDAWLDFVAACRKGGTHSRDIVTGPMADDTIGDYLDDYFSGRISKEAFMAFAKFAHPTHQMSFHTMTALTTLKFLDAKELGKDA